MARLYSNENFPRLTVEHLRRLGHDVLTTNEARQSNQGIPDPSVLAYATAEGRAVVTLNRQDFLKLHRRVPDHPGIVVCTNNEDRLELAQCIHEAVESVTDLRGKLIRVYRPNRQKRKPRR